MENEQQGIRIEAESVLEGLRNKLAVEIQNGITKDIVIQMKERELLDLQIELEELREVVQELKQNEG